MDLHEPVTRKRIELLVVPLARRTEQAELLA
jgi:hypothetical protein